jgi:hypothetical protein
MTSKTTPVQRKASDAAPTQRVLKNATQAPSAASVAASRTKARSAQVSNPFSIRPTIRRKAPSRVSGTPKRAIALVNRFADEFRPEFGQWIEANWHIWKAFCQEAEAVWDSGRRRYSARTIIEFIRHETAMRQAGGAYKINNSYVPDLGRLYGLMKKQRQTFFECRTMAHPIIRSVIRGPGKAKAALPVAGAHLGGSQTAMNF